MGNQTAKLLKLLAKYQPETHKEKALRLKGEAEKNAAKTEKPMHLKFGLNHITTLIEENKTATAVAITDVRREDFIDLEQLGSTFKAQYNDNAKLNRVWGGGIMGIKNQHM